MVLELDHPDAVPVRRGAIDPSFKPWRGSLGPERALEVVLAWFRVRETARTSLAFAADDVYSSKERFAIRARTGSATVADVAGVLAALGGARTAAADVATLAELRAALEWALACARPSLREDLGADVHDEIVELVGADGDKLALYDTEYQLACGMDGTRDVAQLVAWAAGELGLRVSLDEVRAVIAMLADGGCLELGEPDAGAAPERAPVAADDGSGDFEEDLATIGGTLDAQPPAEADDDEIPVEVESEVSNEFGEDVPTAFGNAPDFEAAMAAAKSAPDPRVTPRGFAAAGEPPAPAPAPTIPSRTSTPPLAMPARMPARASQPQPVDPDDDLMIGPEPAPHARADRDTLPPDPVPDGITLRPDVGVTTLRPSGEVRPPARFEADDGPTTPPSPRAPSPSRTTLRPDNEPARPPRRTSHTPVPSGLRPPAVTLRPTDGLSRGPSRGDDGFGRVDRHTAETKVAPSPLQTATTAVAPPPTDPRQRGDDPHVAQTAIAPPPTDPRRLPDDPRHHAQTAIAPPPIDPRQRDEDPRHHAQTVVAPPPAEPGATRIVPAPLDLASTIVTGPPPDASPPRTTAATIPRQSAQMASVRAPTPRPSTPMAAVSPPPDRSVPINPSAGRTAAPLRASTPMAIATPNADAPQPCSQCGFANEPGYQFCQSCGASLVRLAPAPVAEQAPAMTLVGMTKHELDTSTLRTCRTCGSALTLDMRFCGNCGATMVKSASSRPRHAEDNVQFTVYRPRAIQPNRWYPLLAFAHPSEAIPVAEVQRQARQALAEESSRAAPADRATGELSFVAELDGVDISPRTRAFAWTDDVHREDFRIRAPASLDGKTVRGSVTVWLGSLILAELPFALRVAASAPEREDQPAVVQARPYRRIFASYSTADTAIADEIARLARDNEFLRDEIGQRIGEAWSESLARLIDGADVFQLLWSHNSMPSPFCRAEWEYALALNRPGFVRPTYWEDPIPQDPAANLPPPELVRLHFQKIAVVARAPTPAPSPSSFFEDSHAMEAPAMRTPIAVMATPMPQQPPLDYPRAAPQHAPGHAPMPELRRSNTGLVIAIVVLLLLAGGGAAAYYFLIYAA